MFVLRVLWIVSVQRISIHKDGARLFEWDTMFFEVGDGLRDVPRQHILVYTLKCFASQVSGRACQPARSSMSLITFRPEQALAKGFRLREPKGSSRLCSLAVPGPP